MRRISLERSLLAVALAGGLIGCGGEEGGLTLPAQPAPGQTAPIVIRATRLLPASVSTPVQATGAAQANRVAVIGSSISARIEAIPVTEGQTVEAGALLVRLDDRQARLQASQAQAGAAAARVQADQARAEVRRLSPLAERGSIARSRLDQIEAQASAAEANAKAARSATWAAQRVVGDADIVAPFAGTVLEIGAEVGEMSMRSPTLVRLADLATLEVAVRIPVRDLGRLAVGDALVARFPNLDRTIEGTVERFGHEVDPATRTVQVFARIANPDGAIPAGAFVELTITPSAQRQGLVVPRAAVVESDDGPAVFVVDGDVVHRRPVSVRAVDATRVELTDGVRAGQRIVTGGAGGLIEGARVTVEGADAPEAAAEQRAEAAAEAGADDEAL